jgi:hypothetical protein
MPTRLNDAGIEKWQADVAANLLAVCRKAEPILDQYIDDQCERGDTPTDVAIVLVELRHAIAKAEEEPCQPN